MILFSPRASLSHMLILIMVVVSVIGFISPDMVSTFWFRGSSFRMGDWMTGLSQAAVFQFLHGGIWHLLLNAYFLYIAWPEIEARMSRDRFILFFVFSTLCTAIGLTLFENPYVITIGISGFCMSLLSYLWLDLLSVRHPMTTQIGILLWVNIVIGLMNGISFIGHVSGAIAGVIWWFFRTRREYT